MEYVYHTKSMHSWDYLKDIHNILHRHPKFYQLIVPRWGVGIALA